MTFFLPAPSRSALPRISLLDGGSWLAEKRDSLSSKLTFGSAALDRLMGCRWSEKEAGVGREFQTLLSTPRETPWIASTFRDVGEVRGSELRSSACRSGLAALLPRVLQVYPRFADARCERSSRYDPVLLLVFLQGLRIQGSWMRVEDEDGA
ncbi:hypothetical protein KM043_008475 [Ampulex compressa]|nr:hypothetical protein KM043_008475 [Ampulex compressa]